MAPMVIVGIRGGQRRHDACIANAAVRRCGEGRCAWGEVSLDTIHVHAVRHEDAEQEHGHGQYAQQRTRTRAGPDDAPGRPSRNHAVILAALWK
ncbi:hypothetical protein GCM10010309_79810 [Streptomyces violaceochromogenes]|nr:hypothetical protein GCM10010309_79810 [Streptomyces violaceochromogenes]